MRKLEIFILMVTGITWLLVLGGRPFLGLLYYQVYSGIYLTHVFLQFGWLRIPFITALLALLSVVLKSGKRFINFSTQGWLMVALFGVMSLSRFVNGLEVMDHKYMDLFLKLIMAHIVIINVIDSKERFKAFMWVITLCAGVLAFAASYNDTFAAYPWMDKNDFAAILVVAVAFPIMMSLHEKSVLLRAEAMAYCLIIFYGMAGANSRGG